MKHLIMVSAALLASTVLSSSASAKSDPLARTVKATPKAVFLQSTDLNHVNLAVSCTATAAPDPLATFVESCYLKGTGPVGGTYAVPTTTGGMPGPVDTTAGVKLGLPAQPYIACMSARAVFPGAGIEPVETGTVCS